MAVADDAGQIGKIKGSGVIERGMDVVVGAKDVAVQSMDTAVTARGTMPRRHTICKWTNC